MNFWYRDKDAQGCLYRILFSSIGWYDQFSNRFPQSMAQNLKNACELSCFELRVSNFGFSKVSLFSPRVDKTCSDPPLNAVV